METAVKDIFEANEAVAGVGWNLRTFDCSLLLLLMLPICYWYVFVGLCILWPYNKKKKVKQKKEQIHQKKEKVESEVIRKYESFILLETINHKVSFFKKYNGNLCCAANFKVY